MTPFYRARRLNMFWNIFASGVVRGISSMATPDPQAHIANLEPELHWAQLKIQLLEKRWHLIQI